MSNRYGEGRLAPFKHLDHPRPRTRREFLAQGFITGAAWLVGPSLLGLFSSREARAQAISCGLGGAGNKIPFLVFDLAGGASLAGSNVLVGTQTQLDPLSAEGYTKVGLPSGRTPVDPLFVDSSMGIAFHSESAMLRGIKRRATQTTLDRVNGAVFCARSDNDTGNNPHNPVYGIHAAGAEGGLLALVGTESSDSGGNSSIPMTMFDPTARPSKVASPGEARGLVDTGQLVTLLGNSTDAAAVMAAAETISGSKVGKLPETELVKALINCSYQETTELVQQFGDPNQLDPAQDPQLTAIISPAEFAQSEFRKTASIMKLVLAGFAGAGTVEFGGYDYHDGTRATGERKDEIAGQAIGAALQYAAATNRPLVIYILSDGSLSSDGVVDNSTDGDGKLAWRGDNSDTASTVMLVFDPDGRPGLTSVGNQVGRYRASGSVETSGSPIADNVNALAEAVVLNYLALHGEVGQFASVLPNARLSSSPAVLDPLTAFATLPRFGG